jgi:hypothetical protein
MGDEMTATLTTLTGMIARELASMPRYTVDDCREVDLAVAGILDTLQAAVDDCDALLVLQDAADALRATVERDRERELMREAA